MIRVTAESLEEVNAFLAGSDLTLAGPTAELWMQRDAAGHITGTTGYELSGSNALIRSVAVRPELRTSGLGSTLATYALDAAREAGAKTAWLFSRRSGPFWQKLGFEAATTNELAAALTDSAQVQLFRTTGQLEREVAWRRELVDPPQARS